MPVIGDLIAALRGGHLLPYLSVIVAMGLFNVLGSLQNIESAEAAGDSYDTRRSLMINGVGSIAAALFGSAFPTTIYIGHPGWKALGARAGYSVLNGVFITIICLTGTLAWIAWADSDRRGHGDRAVDRHRHQRAGVSGHAARARAGRRHRSAAGYRRLGRR